LAADQLKLRDIVVMGLLRETPRYGYEIKMIIDGVMSHIIDISSGSLYYGMKKLQQAGYLEEAGTQRVGQRPERSIYRLTPLGEETLARELPRVIFPQARPVFPLNLALYFFDQIPKKEQTRRLKMRYEYLALVDKFLDELQQEFGKIAPAGQLAIMRHHKHYVVMERDFITELLKGPADGKAYQLDERDREEIQRELASMRQQVKYQTFVGTGEA
jgi:DNA-binding PadR family transcriptional regulator